MNMPPSMFDNPKVILTFDTDLWIISQDVCINFASKKSEMLSEL